MRLNPNPQEIQAVVKVVTDFFADELINSVGKLPQKSTTIISKVFSFIKSVF